MNTPRLVLGVALAAVAAGALVACPHRDPGPPPVPSPDRYEGGPPADAGPATCATVCAHWGAPDAGGLGCAEGADPVKCVAVCTNVVANNDIVPWDLECRARVATCDQIDLCEGPITEVAAARRVPDASCGAVCTHLAEAGCAPARTPRDASCAAVCENTQASKFAAWNLPCLAAARTCRAAGSCDSSPR